MPDPAAPPVTRSKRRATGSSKGAARSGYYSSPLIIARRNRILDAACKMIGRRGVAAISMDEVARRAGVAKRTLYNAFQSKEHMVALAINRYFEDEAGADDDANSNAALDRTMERLIISARRYLEIRNYARVLTNIYFSAEVAPEMRQATHDIAARPHEAWVHGLARQEMLQPWLGAAGLTDMLVRLRYATVQAWTERLIPDDRFPRELLVGFLTFMAGATIGAAQEDILEALARIDDHPLLEGEAKSASAGPAKGPEKAAVPEA